MNSEEKIYTQHPAGKKGIHILKRRYDLIYRYILKTLQTEKEITFKELSKRAVKELSATFDGKVAWYVVTVKLDMEARNIIERVPKSSLQKIRLKN